MKSNNMTLEEHINRAIQILPADCRIKRLQKEHQRAKMKQLALAQLPGEVRVEFGQYKLFIKKGALST